MGMKMVEVVYVAACVRQWVQNNILEESTNNTMSLNHAYASCSNLLLDIFLVFASWTFTR